MNTLSIGCYNVSSMGYKPYDYLKQAGWHYVSAASADEEIPYLAAADWKDYVLSIQKELERCDLVCVQGHLPGYDLHRDSNDCDDVTDRAILNGVRMAAMLGAKWTAFHCRTALRLGDTKEGNEQSFEDNYKLLSRVVKVARDWDVGIAVENLPDYFIGAHMFATDYHDVIRLVDAMNDPEHVGICWDFGHAQMNHVDQRSALCEIGSRLKATHIHTNSGYNDDHLPIALGTINWDTVAKALADIDYGGSLSMETLWPGGRVAGTTFEMPGFIASQERFAIEFFAHNHRLGMILNERIEEYRSEKLDAASSIT